MNKYLKKHLLWIFFPLLVACGSVEEKSFGGTLNLTSGTETAFLFGSDYVTGQMFATEAIGGDVLSNTGMTNLGGDAVVKLIDGKLYILYRGYQEVSDNIQVVDPLNQFETEHQISTGNGTNPWDFVVVDNKAYIVLYDPTPDVPYDLILLNLETEEVEQGFSFTPSLYEDGYKKARASRIERVENKLYICLQDLGGDTADIYAQNAPGKLVILDLSDNSTQITELKGRNPAKMAYSKEQRKVLITYGAPFDSATYENLFNDPAQVYGGVEILSVDSEGALEGDSVFLHDEKLGNGLGYIEHVVIIGGSFYLTQSNYEGFTLVSDILRLPLTASTEEESEVFLSGFDARDLAVDSENNLWVAWRVVEDEVSASGVEIYDTETGSKIQFYVPTINGSVIGNFFISAIAIGDL